MRVVSIVAQWLTNPTSIHKDVCLIPGLSQWVKDLALLWLWCRLSAAADLTTNLGTSICHGCGPKKIQNKYIHK